MAYIGKSIESGTFSVLDTSGNTYNGSNTTFNLGTQVGSTAQLLVSHDGVIQKPGTDYTLASGGTQITFTTAPASGASIFIVEISGAVGGPLDADLNGTELILDTDGDTSITADTDDQIDIKIAGADDFKFSANAMNVLSGSTLTIDSGATITNSGTANGFGTDPDGAQVFNESGAAVDFRVESDNDANCLIVDGSADKVGMGLAAPEGKLHIFTADASVGPNGDADELVIENGTSGAGVGISLLSATNGEGRIVFGDSGDDNIGQIFYNHGDNSMKFITNASDGLQITSDGRGLSQFTAKVWANLNGNSFGLRDSHNVSSATDNGAGDYTFTFSNSMANTNYAVVSGVHNGTAHGDFQDVDAMINNTGSVRVKTGFVSDTASSMSAHDVLVCQIAIFGD